jgi:DNA-binding PadR family transcriptional regulator
MTRKAEIGEFEHLVMLAALRLGDEAYAPNIARRLEERAGREMSRGTLYAALERLESKGFVEWHIAAASSERSGDRRRLFEVTASGVRALSEQRLMLVSMWEGVEHLLEKEGA